MRSRRQGSQALTVVVLLFALLISLVPHHDHLDAAMICPLLVVAFLLVIPNVSSSLWHLSLRSEHYFPQLPDLPSRFQRPPPSLI